MLKASLHTIVLSLSISAAAAAQGNSAQMAQKMEQTCTGFCHGPVLIAQQRLDRSGWTREVDKMIRWGATVPAAEKEALIDYLATVFNASRPRPNTSKAVPEGKAKDVFQVSCMSCHDDRLIAASTLDRAGWMRQVDRMINWGAYVPAARKEELIDYLLKNFSR